MNRIVAEQVRRNRITRGNWDAGASHRAHVMRLLIGEHAGEQSSRLCILGAGNCNDLDLAALLSAFDEVHLVDLDPESLAAGVSKQGPLDTTRIHLHGGVDVTGVADLLALFSPQVSPTDRKLEFCLQQAVQSPAPGLPGPFDVVASVCLLTQLIDAVVLTLGEAHPRFLDMITAIRLRHLRLLTELLTPGGRGVLVSDIVSTDTAPQLASVPESQFADTVGRLINAHNFFTGANPAVLQSLFATDPELHVHTTAAQLNLPWPWHLGNRTYAVTAVTFHKSAGQAVPDTTAIL